MSLDIYKVDLDIEQPGGGKGETPRSAFTKYNRSLTAIDSSLTAIDKRRRNVNEIDGVVGLVANGAVIERGENANGYYVKFLDGTMICGFSRDIVVAINNAYGSLFQGTWVWVFPASFYESPSVVSPAFAWGSSASWGAVAGQSTASNVTLRGIDISLRQAGSTWVQAVAIGRWK